MLLFLIPGPFTNWARVSLTLPFSLACLLRKRLRELSHGRRDLHRVASPRPPPQPALFTALSFQEASSDESYWAELVEEMSYW